MGSYGILFSTTLHYTWPWFRRQTLAGKGFIVSSFTIFGLVTWADHYLLSYEAVGLVHCPYKRGWFECKRGIISLRVGMSQGGEKGKRPAEKVCAARASEGREGSERAGDQGMVAGQQGEAAA